MRQTYYGDRSLENDWGESEETSLSELDYTDLKFSDRKEDARVSQIDW